MKLSPSMRAFWQEVKRNFESDRDSMLKSVEREITESAAALKKYGMVITYSILSAQELHPPLSCFRPFLHEGEKHLFLGSGWDRARCPVCGGETIYMSWDHPTNAPHEPWTDQHSYQCALCQHIWHSARGYYD